MAQRRELLENLDPVRTFSPEDPEMAELIKSLAKKQQQPIIVHEKSMKIIDGAKRFWALKHMGKEAADVIISDDLFEIVDALRPGSEKSPPTLGRMIDYVRALIPLTHNQRLRPGSRDKWQAKHPELSATRTQYSRQMLSYALGDVWSESAIVRAVTLILRADEGHKLAQELLVRVANGELTVHQADTVWNSQAPKFMGAVKNAAEQRTVLANGPTNVLGAVRAFNTLGSPLKVEPQVLENSIIELRAARTELNRLVRELEREQRKT